jgi:hypothetical protein
MAILSMITYLFTGFGVIAALDSATSTGFSGDRSLQDKGSRHRSVLAQTPKAKQHLVICNAYASPKSLSITQVRTQETLTQGSSLAYKQCQDFTIPLQEGDQLDFKAGNLDVGTFHATGLPSSAASLLLIPHRKTPNSVGVAFESHAFAELQSPQIAVIDAYRGKSKSSTGAVKIIERLSAKDSQADLTPVEEELKFNSVVAVNPGQYEVSLMSSGSKNTASVPLSAGGSQKYVIMRLGAEGQSGEHAAPYPEELLVFPNGAARFGKHLCATLTMAIVALTSLLR